MQKLFAVLTLSAIALLGILGTPASVPLAAQEPEDCSAEEQELVTMLDWILSHPQGQELIDSLSQDIIDKLAVEPMPPPQEP